jgi:dTDP-4-amino-4,6-dideoxygalactose transaminase
MFVAVRLYSGDAVRPDISVLKRPAMTKLPHDNSFLPFYLPEIGDEEVEEVLEVLRSGWLTTGPKTRRFEEEFAQYMGQGFEAVAVNSATAGLTLALEAAGVGPGDEVITTTYTFTATAGAVRHLGADPVFVDVREDTLNINPAAIEAAITDRTKAIVPVHFAGLACEMEEIIAIAKRNNLKIVEDAAHALPTTSGGSLIGTLDTDATVFSFYATKTLTTGEGGMIVTRNPSLARRCRVMRLHGIDRDSFDRYVSTTPAWFYNVEAAGFKCNMTDLAAAIGLRQLRKLEGFQRRREEMAARYSEAFADLCVTLPAPAPSGERHAWHLYVLRLENDAPVWRNQFIDDMSHARIGTSVHFIPLHLQPYWRDTYRLRSEDYPVATKEFEKVVSLPLYTRMTEKDQERVIAETRHILSRSRPSTSWQTARVVGRV